MRTTGQTIPEMMLLPIYSTLPSDLQASVGIDGHGGNYCLQPSKFSRSVISGRSVCLSSLILPSHAPPSPSSSSQAKIFDRAPDGTR